MLGVFQSIVFLGSWSIFREEKRAKLNFQGVPVAASILKERPFVPNVIRSRWLRTHGRPGAVWWEDG